MVVWLNRSDSASPPDTVFQLFTADGGARAAPVTDVARVSSVTPLPNGTLLRSWIGQDGTGAAVIMARTIKPSGDPTSQPPLTVSDPAAGSLVPGTQPVTAVLPNGNFAIAWDMVPAQDPRTGAQWQIRLYSAGGTPLSGPVTLPGTQIPAGTADTVSNLALTPLSDSRIVMTWLADTAGGATWQMQLLNAATGDPAAAPVTLSGGAADTALAVTPLVDGEFLISQTMPDGQGGEQVAGTLFGADGTVLASQALAGGIAPGETPALAALGGGVLLAWAPAGLVSGIQGQLVQAGPDDAPPPVRVSITAAAPVPGAQAEIFTVSLAQAEPMPVTLTYWTQDGTAQAGLNYEAPPPGSTLTFAPGQTSQTIAVTLLDPPPTQAETFSLDLSGWADAAHTVPLQRSATGTIAAVSPPTIRGGLTGQRLGDNGTLDPFAGLAIGDANPGATDSATITVTDAVGVAADANGTLSGAGLVQTGAGTYTLAASTPEALTAALQALVFRPTRGEVGAGQSVPTGFRLDIRNSLGAIATALPADVTVTAQPDYAQAAAPIVADLTQHRVQEGDTVATLSAGEDAITGSSGDDRFIAGPGLGRWVLDGGGGSDTLTLSDTGLHQTTLTPSGTPGTFAMALTGTTIQATGIEAIHFIDGTMEYDPSSTAAQVARLYQAALGRAPDAAGMAFWVGQLQGGASLTTLATSFLGSLEFQARFPGVTGSAGSFVAQLYQNVLGRVPDASGEAFWLNALGSGQANQAQVLTYFADGPENRAGTASLVASGIWVPNEQAAEVARLYYTTLGRAPDESGLSFWTGQLASGAKTLQQEADGFVASAEFQGRYGSLSDQGFVDLLYRNVLGRDADQTGKAFWTGRLGSGAMTRAQVVVGFSESPEHQALLAPQIENSGIVFGS